jgi:hypothetical protein
MAGKKTQDAEAVIHGNHNHAPVSERFAILARLRSGARRKAATVDPHHYREFGGLVRDRSPDVDGEAIFAHARVGEDHVWKQRNLHAARAEGSGIARLCPRNGVLRWLPTQRPDRRGGVRNTEEDIKLAVSGSLSADWTKIDLDDRTIVSNCIKRQEKCKEEYTD